MRVHCLFEQSGTFKNEFKKLGYLAYDYDIQNDFGETDYVVDLFAEIRGGYEKEPSIFDNIEEDDLILAFFPCVRFEAQALLLFRGDNYSQKNWTIGQKLDYDITFHRELSENYELLCKLFKICFDRNLKIVLENPYAEQHYLNRYWCIKPKIVDLDRRDRGDYFKKPTQYWFLNVEPKNNLVFEAITYNALGETIDRLTAETYKKIGATDRKDARSMIHPDYANRFIREFLI